MLEGPAAPKMGSATMEPPPAVGGDGNRRQFLFIHPNFPGQFGPMLSRLGHDPTVECVFLSNNASGLHGGVRCIPFRSKSGATAATHYCSRTFENSIWSAHAVYETCQAARLDPTVIVAHSGFGTSVFLRELYRCPILNLFEFFYHSQHNDMGFRPDFPSYELDRLRTYARNAMILMDLNACTQGYAPTAWQKSLFPLEWASKIQVLHDGIDTELWRRRPVARRIAGEEISADTRIVTYVARGLESMRGFDIFMRVATRVAQELPNVLFVVVGSDRVCYGNDLAHVKTATFREHVLTAVNPDLSRFRFLGMVPPPVLAEILALSDLHIYLTVPFVLSWSLLNALACECTVLASNVEPVREFIRHGETGLLGDFFDVDGLAQQAVDVLRDLQPYRALGQAGRALIEAEYSIDRTYPRFLSLVQRTLQLAGTRSG